MHRGLRKLLERRRDERRAVIEEAVRLSNKLKERLGEVTILLYGSYARGDFNLWSDVDLIVISDAFGGVPFLERVDLIVDLLPPRFEIRCLTPQEALSQFKKAWWKRILREAVVLRDDLRLLSLSG